MAKGFERDKISKYERELRKRAIPPMHPHRFIEMMEDFYMRTGAREGVTYKATRVEVPDAIYMKKKKEA